MKNKKIIPKVTRSICVKLQSTVRCAIEKKVISQSRVNCDLFYSNINRKGSIYKLDDCTRVKV